MKVNTDSEYLETLNTDGKKYVSEFIELMNKEFPQLNHKISISMPMWLVGTKMNDGYVAISGAENHVSIHFSNEEYVCRLSQKLPSCKTGRRCINIKYGDDTSFQFVKDCVKDFFNS